MQNMNLPTNWPTGADCDVFRRLDASNFDFIAEYEIDFNVDFDSWPPSPDAIVLLQKRYPHVEFFEPQEDFNGYIQFKVYSKLNYALVIATQSEVTAELENYGGVCETWGVMQPAP
jgi:Regulator of ribonuclease activity B